MTTQDNETFDVGIVGVGVGANYGSVLTYYSLYKTIESFGKKPLMVSKIGASANDPEIGDTHAMRFAKKHYNLSQVYSHQTVHELNDLVDTFVIGSDQVWNYGISQNFGKAFYLDFAADDKRKISYAASFGHAEDLSPAEEVPKISALMKRFNAISVREDSGVKITRNVYGVPATQVAEPIFLTDVDHYRQMATVSTRDLSEPYLLAYILDPSPEKKAAIEHLAGKLGLKIRIVLDAWPHLFQENKRKIGIEDAIEEGIETYDFLKLYANCSYVVTDSFHGTAFALKFEKPFASIGNRRRGIVRFDSMFRLIGHRDRFTLNAEDIVKNDATFLAPLDYTGIRNALDRHVRDSKKWLQAALQKPAADTIGAGQAKALQPSLPVRMGLPTIVKAVRKVSDILQRRLNKQKIRLVKPLFTANSPVWTVEALPTATRLAVDVSSEKLRGHFVWTDLPEALRPDSAYSMSINWTLRTSADAVNVHLRNPVTDKFKVVGTIQIGRDHNIPRTDKISFLSLDGDYSQIMFGAFHFTGPNAGADIASISLQSIDRAAVENEISVTSERRDTNRADTAQSSNPRAAHS